MYNELIDDTMTSGSCLEILTPMVGKGVEAYVNSVRFVIKSKQP